MVIDNDFWTLIKSNLKAKNSNNKLLQTWFDPTTLVNVKESQTGNKIIYLGVPTKLHQYWIAENLFEGICSEISSIYKRPFEIQFVVTGQNFTIEGESLTALRDAIESQAPENSPEVLQNLNSEEHPGSRNLKLVYTFSTFVVGKNTEFAHAASFNVAQNPGSDGYNPLFIYGPVGMGKTHLLNAVGNHIKGLYPHYRVVYFSAEKFFTECISCIRRGEMDKFRARYRDKVDVMLVDDIPFLGKGQAVQEEFFHVLDDLLHRRCQFVATSDRMPKDIEGLEDRIRSRLEWGLIADIQMPDLETRIAILRYKAEKMGLSVSDDVVSHIARISKRSIRELEGNLKTVKMYSELQGLPLNLELVKRVLASHEAPTTIGVEDIQRLVCTHYNIKINDLKGQSRSKPIVVARQVAMFLIKSHLDKSLVDIGRSFGGKDHTTVINAINRIEDQQTTDFDLKNDINELKSRIHNLTGL